MISHAAITSEDQGEYSIKADFQPMPGVCEPKSVEWRLKDFQVSKPETPFERQYKRKAAVVDQ